MFLIFASHAYEGYWAALTDKINVQCGKWLRCNLFTNKNYFRLSSWNQLSPSM